MMKITRIFVFSVIILGLALVACQPAQTQQPEITGTSWILTTINGEPVSEGVVTAEVTAENTISGSAGCNQYTATYDTDGSNLTFNPEIALTRMACEDALMELEAAYLEVLNNTASYLSDEETLTLLDTSGNELATFSKLQPIDLVGTNWNVTSYNNTEGVLVTPLPGAPITASFRVDDAMVGYTGCNFYSNNFIVDGFRLNIQPISQTRYTCPDDVMVQEALFRTSFGMVGQYKALFDQMEFRSSDGTLVMTLEKLPEVSLTDVRWVLSAFNDGQDALSSPISDTEIDILFENGNISGNSGCNSYSGSYQAGETELTVGPLVMTEMACMEPEGTMEQESTYLSLLQSAASYEINVNFLGIYDESGTLTLLYQADLSGQ